jgi:hypothetical protein
MVKGKSKPTSKLCKTPTKQERKKKITIGHHNYNTQDECNKDVRKKLQSLGLTSSVKNKSMETFLFLNELCKRHPQQEEKLNQMIDFKIQKNPTNPKGLEIFIVNKDNTTKEISWHKCVTGKDNPFKKEYKDALREIINPQREAFKQREDTDLTCCSLCHASLEGLTIHIDHVIHFEKLVDDFTKEYDITIPTKYRKKPITFRRLFQPEDEWIGNLFYKYHEDHAELRVTCDKCNLSREKYKKKT